jgi:hypothetical protein
VLGSSHPTPICGPFGPGIARPTIAPFGVFAAAINALKIIIRGVNRGLPAHHAQDRGIRIYDLTGLLDGLSGEFHADTPARYFASTSNACSDITRFGQNSIPAAFCSGEEYPWNVTPQCLHVVVCAP